jgi:hypothetical protein
MTLQYDPSRVLVSCWYLVYAFIVVAGHSTVVHPLAWSNNVASLRILAAGGILTLLFG